jgi:hypothetical protein
MGPLEHRLHPARTGHRTRHTLTVATQTHRRLLPRSRFPRLLLQGDERPTGTVATGYQDTDRDGRLESFRGRPYVPTTSEATAAWAAGGIATAPVTSPAPFTASSPARWLN